jgi:hypothetical protein
VREGVANEETGCLRDKQTLVLVQRMFQPTQNSRNLNVSCQKRAGPRQAAAAPQVRKGKLRVRRRYGVSCSRAASVGSG